MSDEHKINKQGERKAAKVWQNFLNKTVAPHLDFYSFKVFFVAQNTSCSRGYDRIIDEKLKEDRDIPSGPY